MRKLACHVTAASRGQGAGKAFIADVLEQVRVDPAIRPPGFEQLITHAWHG